MGEGLSLIVLPPYTVCYQNYCQKNPLVKEGMRGGGNINELPASIKRESGHSLLWQPFLNSVFLFIGIALRSFTVELHVNRTGLLAIDGYGHDRIVDQSVLE